MLYNSRGTINIMIYVVRPWSYLALLVIFNVRPVQLYTIASYNSRNILAKGVNPFVRRAWLRFPELLGQEGEKQFLAKFLIDMKKWKLSLAPCREFQQISKRWYSRNHDLWTPVFKLQDLLMVLKFWLESPVLRPWSRQQHFWSWKTQNDASSKSKECIFLLESTPSKQPSLFPLASLYHLAKRKFYLLPHIFLDHQH